MFECGNLNAMWQWCDNDVNVTGREGLDYPHGMGTCCRCWNPQMLTNDGNPLALAIWPLRLDTFSWGFSRSSVPRMLLTKIASIKSLHQKTGPGATWSSSANCLCMNYVWRYWGAVKKDCRSSTTHMTEAFFQNAFVVEAPRTKARSDALHLRNGGDDSSHNLGALEKNPTGCHRWDFLFQTRHVTLDLSEGHGGKVCVRLGAQFRAASPKTNRAIRMRSERHPW